MWLTLKIEWKVRGLEWESQLFSDAEIKEKNSKLRGNFDKIYQSKMFFF